MLPDFSSADQLYLRLSLHLFSLPVLQLFCNTFPFYTLIIILISHPYLSYIAKDLSFFTTFLSSGFSSLLSGQKQENHKIKKAFAKSGKISIIGL